MAPNPPAFTGDEVQAAKSWVSGGGSLFLIADHQPFPAAARTLDEAFGIEVHNGSAFDQEPLSGMLRFKLPEGAEQILPLSSKAESRTVPNPGTANPGSPTEVKPVSGWLQGGLLRFGKGSVAMFGEAAISSFGLPRRSSLTGPRTHVVTCEQGMRRQFRRPQSGRLHTPRMPVNFRQAPAVLAPVLLSLAGLALAQNPPESALAPDKRFTKRVVASGLANPWEIAWGPDNMLWVTERTGKRITRVDPITGERKVAATLGDAASPGGQDGVLGMALHPDLLKGKGADFVFVAYTSIDRSKAPDRDVKDASSPYQYLYMRVVRFTWDAKSQTLSSPTPILTGLPAGDDHNGGRLKFGPDGKLYLTTGDQGHNQFGNFCLLIEAQRLPTQAEIAAADYSSYVGKSLRINLDGSIPEDNPTLNGVRSHVYTYGHRNPQGLAFAPDGTLYESEHGPKTDDEVNVLKAGANYGWPHVAGFKDDKAYVYARWAAAPNCRQLEYNDFNIPASIPSQAESAFNEPIREPLAALFTVPTGHDFKPPACKGFEWICWPTVGIGSLEHYESKGDGIPGWDRVLLVTSLKRGSLYVIPLKPDGQSGDGRIYRYFRAENRYRDVEVGPDRRTIYIATDPGGGAESLDGRVASAMQDKGAILAFTYAGEGPEDPPAISRTSQPSAEKPAVRGTAGAPPQFTAQQSAAGKKAYRTRCAGCHGTTLTNGVYGTALAGNYFHEKWSGRTVRSLFDKSKSMPPSAPSSLSNSVYAEIVAFILEANGAKPGDAPLQAGGEFLDRMTIR